MAVYLNILEKTWKRWNRNTIREMLGYLQKGREKRGNTRE